MSEPAPDVRTIADLPFHAAGRFPKPLMIGRCRDGVVEGPGTRALFDRIRDTALGLASLGLAPGDRVAILSESRPEWVVCDMAVQALGGVTVPIYPNLSPAHARYILDDSGARIAVVSSAAQLAKLEAIRHLLPRLEAVVVMDRGGAGATASVTHLDEVAGRGHARLNADWGAARSFRDGAREVRPDQLATIIYTSGTTGEPKGVMLSHANLVSNLIAAAEIIELGPEDAALSFLPLSHAFERMASFLYLFTGTTMIFAESFDTIGRDIATVRPTMITAVPRIYEKMQARILDRAAAAPRPKAALFRWALRAATRRARAALSGARPGVLAEAQARLADRLVLSKVRAGVGGRIRYAVSGSAPLPVSVLEFFLAVGLPIIEGYGLTETAPILTVNPPDALKAGRVGKPVRGVEIRIAPDGEILARGANVMSGYYRKPEATAEVLRDGWFHTGDVGAIDADGYLSITDRKKDLLVTSGGKKIAPQPIENVLRRSPLVAEAVVLGDRRHYAVALIVPEFAALDRRLRDLGRETAGREELVGRDDVVDLYAGIVAGVNRDLSHYERIKRFALLPTEFSVDSGELTPTLKVKRRIVEERWAGVVEGLYPH